MGAGFVCGMVFMLAVNGAQSSSTMAYTSGATMVKPATAYAANVAPAPTVRANAAQDVLFAAEEAEFRGIVCVCGVCVCKSV